MKLINCPHCSKKVSVDTDDCSFCGKQLFSYSPTLDDADYERHYSDFIDSTFTPRGIYKFHVIVSILLMFVSAYVIFFEHYNKEAPVYSYYLFLTGFVIYAATRYLIYKDKKKEMTMTHIDTY